MEEISDEERERRLKILQSLLNKTAENGCTEEEMMVAAEKFVELSAKWAIEEHELGENLLHRKTFVRRWLDIKYGNKWRWELANTVAWNAGVLALHYKGGNERVMFYGREHVTEAAAGLAEYLISTIEKLSSEFARETGLGTTGKRRFARGCAAMVRSRVYQSSNLSTDPRLPAIYKQQRDEAIENFDEKMGKKKQGRDADERSVEFMMGAMKGETIALRQKTKEIS